MLKVLLPLVCISCILIYKEKENILYSIEIKKGLSVKITPF